MWRRQIGSVWTAIALAVVLSLAGSARGSGPIRTSPWSWEAVPKIVALGDLHGSLKPTVDLLGKMGLLSDDLHWTGGGTHLVFLGDLLDRGPRDLELLDLVIRLQEEAPAQGGRVHVLLGNHEVMNLVQDFRYVSAEGFARFASREDPDVRAVMKKRFIASYRPSEGAEAPEPVFERKYPPGYFARADAFGPEGEYAAWLMQQKVVLRINGYIFVHGGLVEEVAALGLEAINQELLASIRSYWRARDRLVKNRVLPRYCSFRKALDTADTLVADRTKGRNRKAAETIQAFADSLAVSEDGPLWYRGNSREDERLERARVFASLEALGGKSIVVGHTITRSGKITSRFDGRVIRADVGSQSRGRIRALVLAGGKAVMFDPEIGEDLDLEEEPLWGEKNHHPASRLPRFRLEKVLAEWDPVSVRPLVKGKARPLLVTLRRRNAQVRGVFKDVEEKRPGERFQHEIAAYLADRELGLGLVPVTVPRKLPSVGEGSLQYFVEGAMDREMAEAYGRTDPAREREAIGLSDAEAFDRWIGIRREPDNILYVPGEGQIVLIDHAEAFSPDPDIRRFAPGRECRLSPEMRSALAGLDMDSLARLLEDWLGRKQIRALSLRRDALLADCGPAGMAQVDSDF